MKFNTQVCTTREQSERLLALGLKKETADCHYWYAEGKWYTYIGKPNEFNCIPAWSLHRLIALCPKLIVHRQSGHEMSPSVTPNGAYYEDNFTYPAEEIECFDLYQDLYDNLMDCIEWLINNNHFNKQYLS